MKSLAYIVGFELYDYSFNGKNLPMINKITAQCRAFFNLGYRTYILTKSFGGLLVLYDFLADEQVNYYCAGEGHYYSLMDSIINERGINIVYVRKPFLLNYFDFNFYKKLQLNLPDLKIIFEIPTFPYDNEADENCSAALRLDIKYRNRLKSFLKYTVNYSRETSIWGIDSVPIVNGVDLTKLPPISTGSVDDTINIISISTLWKWTGYERMFRGLANYYYRDRREKKVIFHIVGDGVEYEQYKHLTKQLLLQDVVVFYGKMDGEALDYAVSGMDIGLMSLGFNKINLKGTTPLRLAEYSTRGLPFIYAFEMYAIPDDWPYALKLKTDDSDVDIQEIIEWYYRLKNELPNFRRDIRNFAKSLSWDAQMRKVLEFAREIL